MLEDPGPTSVPPLTSLIAVDRTIDEGLHETDRLPEPAPTPRPTGSLARRAIPVLFMAIGGLAFASAAPAAPPASAPMWVEPPARALRATAPDPPARIAESFGVAPLAELAAARDGAPDELRALVAHNRSGGRPLQNGFSRPLPVPRRVRFDGSMAGAAGRHDGGAFLRSGGARAVWGAEVRVEEAHRLRLHLDNVRLPAGTRLWVYGRDGVASRPFGLELRHEDGLWTPSVGGPVLRLEVELPAEALDRPPEPGPRGRAADPYGFVIDRVAELVRLDPRGTPLANESEPIPWPAARDTGCIEDLSCHDASEFSVIDAASLAIAQLLFMEGRASYACTGGLLTDFGQTGTPWLLTAHHCVSTQEAASSLEATWDWRTSSCDGPEPPRSTRPTSHGATLITSRNDTDHSLLRLLAVPPGRAFLGWHAEHPVNLFPLSTPFHRIHHPAPDGILQPQRYTRFERIADGDIKVCPLGPDDPPVNDPAQFLHTRQVVGGDFGGSSGAPILLGNGQVVGQLFGACGPAPQDGCDVRNDTLDGAFYESFHSDATLRSALRNKGRIPPAFRKDFSPPTILVGGVTTLTFTIDNRGAGFAAEALDFTDDLPAGMAVAAAPDATTTCTGGVLTASAGGGTIGYTGGSLLEGETCTVRVDVTATATPGTLVNTSGDLTSSSGSSGPAIAALEVLAPDLTFEKEFLGAPTPGGTVDLRFSLTNAFAEPVTGLTFNDDLDGVLPGLAAVGLPQVDVCGVGSRLTGGAVLTLTDGFLQPGGTCSFTVSVQLPPDLPAAPVTNVTGPITFQRDGAATGGPPATAVLAPNALAIPSLSWWGLALLAGAIALLAWLRLSG